MQEEWHKLGDNWDKPQNCIYTWLWIPVAIWRSTRAHLELTNDNILFAAPGFLTTQLLQECFLTPHKNFFHVKKFPNIEKELTKWRTQAGPNTYWILTVSLWDMYPLNTVYLIYINIYTKDDVQGYETTCKSREEIYVAHPCKLSLK